jgi:hypothetical protein
MRKFKVIKKWPGGPEVGSVIPEAQGYNNEIFIGDNSFPFEDFIGFVEEIKEPEEFWFVELDGKVVSSEQIDDHDCVAKEFRFPTRESATAFADFMKKTCGKKIDFTECNETTTSAEDYVFTEALNSRIHD